MKIALCARAQEAGQLCRRIASAVPDGCSFVVFHDVGSLLEADIPAECQLAWIALDGAEGMETVIAARDCYPAFPLVWMSEDRMFASIACDLKVVAFLHKDCGAQDIVWALEEFSGEKRRGAHAYRVML